MRVRECVFLVFKLQLQLIEFELCLNNLFSHTLPFLVTQEVSEWLLPVFVEHDRSSHAERMVGGSASQVSVGESALTNYWYKPKSRLIHHTRPHIRRSHIDSTAESDSDTSGLTGCWQPCRDAERPKLQA